MTPQLELRARKDFDDSGLDECDWKAFFKGWIDAMKRFGGK